MDAHEATTFNQMSPENAALVMASLECDCLPYVNVFTYKRWQAQGFQVRRGEKAICKITVFVRRDKKDDAGEVTSSYTIPKLVSLFCRCQVDETGEKTGVTHKKNGSQSKNTNAKQNNTQVPAKNTPSTRNVKLAERFRKMADNLTDKIADKRAPMTQNWTPKRGRQQASNLHDANNMERTQQALRVLADLHEQGTVPPELADVKTKTAIENLVRTRWASTGYYEGHDSGEYSDTSEAGVMLQSLINGNVESKEIKRQKADMKARSLVGQVPGYFPTPPEIVEQMISLARIANNHTVLEPSAGGGAIADIFRDQYPETILDCVEYNYSLREILKEKGHTLVGQDFLEGDLDHKYDRVLMNPPFENGADIDHVFHAYKQLADNGILVAIMSEGVFFRSDKKTTEFREWLDEQNSYTIDLDQDAFKASGTGVKTRIVVIEK